MNDIDTRLERVGDKLREPSFRQNSGLGNEVGYYVFDYPAEEELAVREKIKYWQAQNSPADGFTLVVFDLYDVVIDLLEKEDFLEQCFRFEQRGGMERITKAVSRMLRLGDGAGLIVQYIRERTPEGAVVFLTGVGKCYPILRAHKVLNHLHQAMDDVPVIMFYPGKYDGQALMLFSKIKDDNYYRAFRLAE
jgi:hypothetical protein